MFQDIQELKGSLKLELKWVLFCILHTSLALILFTLIYSGLLINFNITLLDTASGRGFISNYTLPTTSFVF
jgi:hypothetical protein